MANKSNYFPRRSSHFKNYKVILSERGSREAGENIITKKDIDEFIIAGADIVLMPAPGTVPGITMEYVRELVVHTHKAGKLTLTAIGTSQEGADTATIKQIALMCKMSGTDLHHLGDAGYIGMSLPENILEYGKTIRGVWLL